MKDQGSIVEHHEPEDQIAERMKEWQDPEHPFLLVEMQDLCGALGVGIYTIVREHHAFWFSGAAAAENNCDEIIDRDRNILAAGPLDDASWRKDPEQARQPFVLTANGGRHVFYPEHGRSFRQFQFRLLDE